MARCWPILAGIAIAPVMLVLGLLDELAKGVAVAAVIYVIWGTFRRRQPGHARWYAIRLAGLAAFGALNLLALAVDEPWLRYLLALGWVGHATWDAVHHRANRIVPRWYADTCIGLDLALAAPLVAWPGSVSSWPAATRRPIVDQPAAAPPVAAVVLLSLIWSHIGPLPAA